MKRRSQISAAVLAALFSVIVLFSSVFIIEHAGHECIGEDCPVCEQLDACAETLKELTAVIVFTLIVLELAASPRKAHEPRAPAFVPHTPVLLKVKLSN